MVTPAAAPTPPSTLLWEANLTTNNWRNLYGGIAWLGWLWQPGVDAVVDRWEWLLRKTGAPVGTLEVELWSWTATGPTEYYATSGSVALADVGVGPDWVTIPGAGLVLNSWATYAIVLHASAGDVANHAKADSGSISPSVPYRECKSADGVTWAQQSIYGCPWMRCYGWESA